MPLSPRPRSRSRPPYLQLPTTPTSSSLTSHLEALSPPPSPLPFLHHHQPSLHIYLSLLSLLPSSPSLLRLSSFPSAPAKPTVATAFVLAVSSVPARVPADVRRALTAAGRVQGAALVCALGGFQGTVCALLGLTEGSSAAVSDVTADSLSARAPPPDDDVASTASTAPSLTARVAAVAKGSVAARLAAPLRARLAARAVRRAARAHWLADLPPTRRAQDDYVRATMGFTPRYLADVRSPAARATFVYAIDAVLLADSQEDGLSTAVKNLVCYILARRAENPTLTAHSAFLANRFGARDAQLAACMDLRFLCALDARYRRTKRDRCPVSLSSAATTTEESVDFRFRSPRSPMESTIKRTRSRAELADKLEETPLGAVRSDRRNPVFANALGMGGARLRRSFSFRRRKRDEKRFQLSPEEGVVDPTEDLIEEPATMSDLLSSSDTAQALGLFKSQTGVPDLNADEEEERGSESSESSEESDRIRSGGIPRGQNRVDIASKEPSFYDLGDNPEVPDVHGLNAMEDAGEDEYVFDEDDYATYRHFEDVEHEDGIEVNDEDYYFDDDCERNGFGESIFSDKEVAVLLLAHDVARSSRRNSLRVTKCPDAPPGPLLTPAIAAQVHDLFEPEAIMEIVSVVAVFQLLQRWTVCYPYRPGSLEAPVRKFVQTPIAHDLSVGSVGQRSASKSSASLRTQQGRSIRLPRHAVVDVGRHPVSPAAPT